MKVLVAMLASNAGTYGNDVKNNVDFSVEIVPAEGIRLPF
jgi:hypothetical protein